MVKKKNRKKELKRQQKLEVTVLSEQEAKLFEREEQAPIFYEERMIPHFDFYNVAVSQLREENKNLTDDELRYLPLQIAMGDFSWRRDHALYKEAMVTPNDRKRKKLLRQVLAENPDYFLAELHLWLADWDVSSPSYFRQTQDFQDRTIEHWKKERFADWYAFTARPYLTALVYLIDYYCEAGFYSKALELVTLIDSKQPSRFPTGFVVRMLSLYNRLGLFDKVERFYQMRVKEHGAEDDTVLVHLLIARILQGRWKEAEHLFERLSAINPATPRFFLEDTIFHIERMEDEIGYRLLSMESLASHLVPLMDFLLDVPLILEFLREKALDRQGGDFFENSPFGFWELFHMPVFRDLRMNAVQIFYKEGFRSKKDFEARTEKEVLALKGIGAKTIEQLKKNGIVFKRSE
ncbi:tetratricopeptide repeat protein [Streptococcus acidominimus]|uniref:Helicase n=1 Tax=Streptococcus acidominimus TaxID=1326 RepID=A0A1Q8ECL5_STRAI|nr:hypothetical protein [Streptococcus acidominimus]MBF0848392.1 hypothetical protein [Streptococcus danieliae]MBF0818253.1 hypothetical protein [Streptococcus acidominimus]MBF0838570.1 hypothetical protein [Streptococcus acidominimus]OLF49536.1 hypothetical protein BU200_06785 [Streptococcus acidominimus]TFU31552.1 hypothetical protein E4U01_02120 [Streptococcus acidominimus]